MLKVAAVIMLLLAASVAQQGSYRVEECALTVYRDGIAHVYFRIAVEELEPYIAFPLLSSPNKIDNILILDENNEPLTYDYHEENNTIIIYSLGAREVKLEYDTSGLTSMEYGLWTLKVTLPSNATLRFPEGATIIYVSAPPMGIRSINGQIEMLLTPGNWEISYEIPLAPPPPPTIPGQQILDYMKYYIIAGICAICASIIAIIYFKRRRILRSLGDEEMEVLKFIRERGGRALEAELRERFPHIPRTSMWRLIRRLEKRGIVQVRKVGLQNLIELK